MLLQPATHEMMPMLRELWRASFGDEGGYTDFVFRELLRPERILAIPDEAGRPLAMLCTEPVRVLAGAASMRGAYIYGVATDPAHRGRGLSTRLLEETHPYLTQRGAALSMLVPASGSLFGYYQKRGYATAFHHKQIEIENGAVPAGTAGGVLVPARLDQLDGVRGRYFAGSALFPAWERDWLRYTHLECRRAGGEVLRYGRGGASGYAVCYPWGDRLLVKELAIAPDELGGLLAALHARYRKQRYTLRVPVDFPLAESGPFACTVLPFGMVKWYDKEMEQKADGSGGRSPWFAFVLD